MGFLWNRIKGCLLVISDEPRLLRKQPKALYQGMDYEDSLSCPMDLPEPCRFANKTWTEFSRTVKTVLIITLMTVLCFQMTCYLKGRPSMCPKQTPQCWIYTLRIQVFIWTIIYISPGISIFVYRSDSDGWKTQSVIDWPIPKITKEVGSVNFYHRFIPEFADNVAPLTPLTGNNATFKWDTDQQTAFRQLRQAIISPPLLDHFRSNDHFILTTDASEVGLGAILSAQKGTTIEFANRVLYLPKLSTTQQKKDV